MRCVLSRWERFWFTEVPSESFALVRIGIGVAGLVDLLGLMPIAMFWSPDGIAPTPGGGLGLRAYLLDSGLADVAGSVVFTTMVVSFCCMTLGLFTVEAVTACFLGSVFQRHWNTLPLNAAHTILVAVLFCLVWADCGRRLSLDAWRKRRRTKIDDSAFQPIWPLRLIRIQVAIVYASSGLFKLLSEEWRNGSAIHSGLANNIYGRIFYAFPFPAQFDWMLTLLTYSTLFWELTFALLLLNRITRAAALLMGVAFHLGIWATMEVGSFSLVMLATYAAFLDPHKTARVIEGRLGQRYPTKALPKRTREGGPLEAA